MRKQKLIVTLLLSAMAAPGLAQDRLRCDFGYEGDFLPFVADSDTHPVDVKADDVQIPESGTSIFTGNVDVTRGGQHMNAQRATYNRMTGDVTASGDVRLRDSEIIIDAEQAEWSLTRDEGRMLDAEYRIRQMHARGEATHVYRQGTARTDLKNATYTTCPVGSDAWQLKAADVHLDHVTAVGEARNVVLRMAGMPVFYTPYINFPLNDERKSGFLIPTIGSSSDTGFDLSTPYYWNIAPNLDATATPRYMSDRGLMLSGQFRYLYEQGEGEMTASFLGSDNLRRLGDELNPNYNEDRKLFSWQHDSRFARGWRSRLDYNYVSDNFYFDDFGTSFNMSRQTHLNRLLEAGYRGDIWDFTARLQGFQTLEDRTSPYKRLPQLRLRGYLPDQALGLSYELDAEYVEFDHDERVDGRRIDLEPAVSLPMGTAGFFVTPRVALNHTRYDLGNNDQGRYDDNATRTVPVSSLDTGLIFERAMRLGNDRYLQTLEPRAFYLYIPRRDQSDLPRFDTALSNFNMIRLFSYDRFTGRDRVGDANQLSLALTSRIINEKTGQENLRLTLGQIQYFSNREVTLNSGQQTEDRNSSDMIAEAVAYIGNAWSINGEIQWDPDDSRSNMSSTGLRYRGDNGAIFNITHRYRRDDPGVNNGLDGLEHVDISAQVPVASNWTLFGRWYRSLDQARTLEGLAGVQYDSCCWATRLVLRNYVKDYYYGNRNEDALDRDRNLAIYLQVELKGLGSFGKKSDSLLTQSIRGLELD